MTARRSRCDVTAFALPAIARPSRSLLSSVSKLMKDLTWRQPGRWRPEGTVMSNANVWPDDRRITIHDLQAATDRGERWPMLTSYDTLTAGIFEQAGVRALLVGDTSAEMVLGYRDTLPVTMDQLIPMVQPVLRGPSTPLGG